MSVELQKKTQKAGVILAKKGLTAPPIMRVAVAIDISGSMDDEIKDGSVQKIMDQLLGIGAKFDDDGSIDIFQFDDRADYVGVCAATSFGSYVNDVGLRSRGGTRYVPIIDLINRHMFTQPSSPVAAPPAAKKGFFGFGGKEAGPAPSSDFDPTIPVLVFFITDGESSDSFAAVKASLEKTMNHPIYWQLIGINNQGVEFKVLRQLGDDLPNTGFIKMNGFNQTDEQLYGEVISDELVAWVKKAGQSGSAATA